MEICHSMINMVKTLELYTVLFFVISKTLVSADRWADNRIHSNYTSMVGDYYTVITSKSLQQQCNNNVYIFTICDIQSLSNVV